MPGGYTGKILEVDVTNKESKVTKTDIDACKQFIGAKGLGAKLLFDRLPPLTDPLSSENLLMFTSGPLTGTRIQTSGRGTVITKSPLTSLFLDSHFGGFFSWEMKKAGWDLIIITGRSQKPVYLVVKNEDIIFKDATSLWGRECLETHKALQKLEGKTRTAVIGPAGEQKVKFSSITIDGERHAGRGGSGAVMGSKNLKAIVLSGTNKISLHYSDEYIARAKDILRKIQENDFVPIRRKYGTPFWVETINNEGMIPTRNFQEGYFEDGKNLSAKTMQKRIVDEGGACYNCVIACWNKSSIKRGDFKGVSLVGPEYETLALMGTNLGMKSVEDVAYLNERCNEYGMDSISLGCVLSFAVEAFNKGVLTKLELGDIDIGWGKPKELATLVKNIAHRETIAGNILAEGVKIASEKIGNNSDLYAIHAKGLEVPGYDPRGTFGMGLAYATSDRGACHQRAWTVKAELNDPELDRFSFEKKAEIVKNVQDERAAFFSLVLCDFAPISEEDCVDMLNLATGFNHTVESYLLAGERIWNLIRLFNIRESLSLLHDDLPSRFFDDSFTQGPVKGITLSKSDFQKSLQEYYKLRGWTNEGIPKKEKLMELGLISYQEKIN